MNVYKQMHLDCAILPRTRHCSTTDDTLFRRVLTNRFSYCFLIRSIRITTSELDTTTGSLFLRCTKCATVISCFANIVIEMFYLLYKVAFCQLILNKFTRHLKTFYFNTAFNEWLLFRPPSNCPRLRFDVFVHWLCARYKLFLRLRIWMNEWDIHGRSTNLPVAWTDH